MKKLLSAVVLFSLCWISTAQACLSGVPIGRGQSRVFLQATPGTTYTTPFVIPNDWTGIDTIDAYGEGGGDFNNAHISGGGGAFARVFNLNDAIGTSEPLQIGGGNTVGSGGSATPTYFKSTSYLKADYGRQTAGSFVGGLGGITANSVGTVLHNGGNAASGSSTVKGTGAGGAAALTAMAPLAVAVQPV